MRRLFLLALFMVFSLVSVFASYKVTILNPNSYNLTDYQVRIDLSYYTNGTYLKVCADTGCTQILNFCYEQSNGECNVTPSGIIWVKVPNIPANGETTIYIFGDTVNNAVDGSKVFDFYDDFNDGILDSKWVAYDKEGNELIEEIGGYLHLKVYNNNTNGADLLVWGNFTHLTYESIDVRMQIINSSYGGAIDGGGGLTIWDTRGDYDPYNGGEEWLIAGTDGIHFGLFKWSSLGYTAVYALNENDYFHEWSLRKLNTTIKFYYDGSYITSTTKSIIADEIGIGAYNLMDVYVDWIRIRKYADQEPIIYTINNVTINEPQDGEIKYISRIPLNFTVKTEPTTFEININNPNSYDLANYQIRIDLSDYLDSAVNLAICLDKDNCENTLLPFCYEQPNGECNTTPSKIIWTKVNITANSNKIIYIETSGTNYAVNGSEVFEFYDDFNDGILASGWVNDSGIWGEANGYLYVINHSTTSPGSIIRWKDQTFPIANVIIEGVYISYNVWAGILFNTYQGALASTDNYLRHVIVTSTSIQQDGSAPLTVNAGDRVFIKIWADSDGYPYYIFGKNYNTGEEATVIPTYKWYLQGYVGFWISNLETSALSKLDWIRVRKRADQELTITIEKIYPLMTAEIWVDGLWVKNVTVSNMIPYITEVEILKEGNHTIEVKVWDPTGKVYVTDSVSITLDLYDENVSYSNYTTYNNTDYVDTIAYTISVRCGALGHNVIVDAWNGKGYTITCDNTTKTIQDSYRFQNEGNQTTWFYLNAVDPSDSRYFGNDSFVADINPPVIQNLTTTIHTGFFTSIPQETGSFSVYDKYSPYVICNYTFVNVTGQFNITSSEYNTTKEVNYTPIMGTNTLKVVCWDLLNHSSENSIQKAILLYTIYPIDEETGLYDTSLWVDPTTGNMSLIRFIAIDKDQNESFIYENISEKLYLELLGTKEWVLQVEQRYSDQYITNTYYLKYAPNDIYVCISQDVPNIFQVAYASVPLEGKAFAVTRSETGCLRVISPTQIIQEGYGFYFYTTAGLYALWVIDESKGYDSKTLLTTFKGDVQTALDLEKAILLIQAIETIPIPSYHFIYVKKVPDQNATLISYKSNKLIKEFKINITKLGEEDPFYSQVLHDSKEIKIELLWSPFNLSATDEIVIDYYAEFEDGTIDQGRLIVTPSGRVIKFLWWQAALILMSPMVILFFRRLKPRELFVFAILYVIMALLVLPYAEINIFTQIFGILGVVSLVVVILIVLKVI